MTQFEHKTFSVGQRGRDPARCPHGWTRWNALLKRDECVQCGAPIPPPDPTTSPR